MLVLLVFPGAALAQSPSEARRLRAIMVREEIEAAGVEDERVLRSMRDTPRHEFVPLAERRLAYYDMALPIGEQQTISPPFVVAYMTEQLRPTSSDKVLEIGTGSGYQAAVLSPLVKDVYTIEIVAPLGRRAARVLKRLGYKNVHTKIGDGYEGWPEAAPFDKIIVTCSPEKIPQPLVDQLAEGGEMIIPVGERYQQNLYRVKKIDGQLVREPLRATLFVPMTGSAEESRSVQPDPTRPSIENGSFESTLAEGRPTGWHYLRQAELVDAGNEAPDGDSYLRFKNTEPGRNSQVLQGFAIDGRKVSRIRVSLMASGDQLRFGQSQRQWPHLAITFYDERRAVVDEVYLGPFEGTFDWTEYDKVVQTPLAAREAILRVGLLGGIGELAIDDVTVASVER